MSVYLLLLLFVCYLSPFILSLHVFRISFAMMHHSLLFFFIFLPSSLPWYCITWVLCYFYKSELVYIYKWRQTTQIDRFGLLFLCWTRNITPKKHTQKFTAATLCQNKLNEGIAWWASERKKKQSEKIEILLCKKTNAAKKTIKNLSGQLYATGVSRLCKAKR